MYIFVCIHEFCSYKIPSIVLLATRSSFWILNPSVRLPVETIGEQLTP